MKKKVSYTLLLLYSPWIFSANQQAWQIELGLGSKLSPREHPAPILNFEQGLFDVPHKAGEQDKPSLSLSVQKQIKSIQPFDVLMGLSLYYLRNRQSGQVWGMNQAQFYNFDYRLKTDQLSGLLETRLKFKQNMLSLTPSVFAGIGMDQTREHYDEKAVGFYPPSDEIHSSHTHKHIALDFGASLQKQLSSKCALKLSYIALDNGQLEQLVFLQMNYRLGNMT